MENEKRSSFSGRIGFVLSAAGASVGLGNIWRFPYLAAKYGGGIFLLIYIVLALTFGYTMIMAETALGRMTGKSPVGAYASFAKPGKRGGFLGFGGWINAIIPVLIVPYYSVIGGWVIRYLVGYLAGQSQALAADGFFSDFISNGAVTEICFLAFALFTLGILVTFGSYMKKDVSIEDATQNVEVFDTIIAVMAGLMIIPAVFAFSDGEPDTLQAGPALMFITLPKVFASMDLGRAVGVLFFVLVLFAAVTSSIALTESAVSTFQDELGWSRRKATVLVGVIMVGLGTLSSLGYGPLAGVTVLGMQFLDFFDFLTNSVMMPIAAIATCLLVSRVVGVERIEHEVTLEGGSFRRKKVFNFMIRWLCPVFAAIILASSVANAFGIIAM